MNEYLLDASALIKAVHTPEDLPARVADILESDAPRWMSIASLWEINIKCMKGGLRGSVRDYHSAASAGGVEFLPLDAGDVHALTTLARWKHKDPFDRMIVAVAQSRGLSLITSDETIRRYLKGSIW